MTSLATTARLPHGYRCTFSWHDRRMNVEWEPDVPSIRSRRAWRKFFAAYQAARTDFLRDVATVIGGNVGVMDLGDREVTVIEPGVRH